MKLFTLISLICLLVLLPVQKGFSTEPSDKSEDYLKICTVLNYYFQGVNLKSVDALARAYHPRANFTYVDTKTGEYERFQVGQYLSSFAEKPPQRQRRTLKLLRLDITGNAAMVKTQILYEGQGKRINDYLSLLKIDDEWRIVSRTSYKEYATFDQPRGKKERQQVKNHQEIHQTVETYLKGHGTHDLDQFRKVFHPQADVTYIDPKHGTYHNVSLPGYFDMHTSQEDRTYKRQHDILSVDITGNTAIAKVEIRYKQFKTSVTDYIYLVKSKGSWSIIHKASHKEKGALMIPV